MKGNVAGRAQNVASDIGKSSSSLSKCQWCENPGTERPWRMLPVRIDNTAQAGQLQYKAITGRDEQVVNVLISALTLCHSSSPQTDRRLGVPQGYVGWLLGRGGGRRKCVELRMFTTTCTAEVIQSAQRHLGDLEAWRESRCRCRCLPGEQAAT